MQVDRDLVRATVPPLLAACVVALILGRVDDPVPAPAGTVPAAEPVMSARP
jgi:hypothetical protein